MPEPEDEIEIVTEQSVRAHRSPRYVRFMIVGAVFFVIVAFILTYSLPQGAGYDRNGVFGWLVLLAVALGVALGSIVALVLERIARRRARVIAASRVQYRALPDESDLVEGETPSDD